MIISRESVLKVIRTKGRSGHPQDKDFHGEKWTNQTHRSTTDPDARLYSKSKGKGAFPLVYGP